MWEVAVMMVFVDCLFMIELSYSVSHPIVHGHFVMFCFWTCDSFFDLLGQLPHRPTSQPENSENI